MMTDKRYEEAIGLLNNLQDYKDSGFLLYECYYENNDYKNAIEILKSLPQTKKNY